MKKSVIQSYLLIVFLSVFSMNVGFGQDCNEYLKNWQDDYEDALFNLIRFGCLGGTNDNDTLTVIIQGYLERIDYYYENNNPRGAIKYVQRSIGKIQNSIEAQDTHPVYILLLSNVRAAYIMSIESENAPQKMDWHYDLDEGILLEINRDRFSIVGDLLVVHCDENPHSEACEKDFHIAKNAIRYTILMNRVADSWRFELLSYEEILKMRDQQWSLYATEARAQYPWELWVNSWFYKRSIETDTPLTRRIPPGYQVILLHPGLALEYVNSPNKWYETDSVLMIEWIGLNFWSWRESEQVGMGTAFGLSIITTYAAREGIDNFGHGVVIHLAHTFSAGATYRYESGDIGYVLSMDLKNILQRGVTKVQQVSRYFGWEFPGV